MEVCEPKAAEAQLACLQETFRKSWERIQAAAAVRERTAAVGLPLRTRAGQFNICSIGTYAPSRIPRRPALSASGSVVPPR